MPRLFTSFSRSVAAPHAPRARKGSTGARPLRRCTAALLLAAGCAGTPDVAAWQAARFPTPAAALSASELLQRSEADSEFLAAPSGSAAERAQAALSAEDFAERAIAAGADGAAAYAQLAHARGAATHLKPMFGRAEQARRTREAIDRALALDPAQPKALATLATLELRLATLPWIARTLAVGAPEGDLGRAADAARRAIAAEPSIGHRLLLARALAAGGDRSGARAELDAALAAPDRYPHDPWRRADAVALRSTLAED